MRAHELAAEASSFRIVMFRETFLRVLLLVRTLLMVSLRLRENVKRNRTRHLVDHRCYAP